MSQHPSSILSKPALTCHNNYQGSYNSYYPSVDQLNTIFKFDEREIELCGFINDISVEIVRFFFDLFLRKGLSTNFSTDQLYGQIQKSDAKIQQIVRSPKEMKDFLSKYSSLFMIDGEKISLNNSTQLIEGHLKWIKALLQNDYPDINRTALNAIQFYSDILYEKEDNFPIDMLVTHRNKAKQDVQIIAVNPLELKSFLVAYPQVFILKDDKISLTYSAVCERSDYSWLGEMCGMNIKPLRLRTWGKAVTYFLLILYKQDVHQLPLSKLFAFRNAASTNIKELIKTMADLKKLFVKYLCVFQINKTNVMIKNSLLTNLKRDEVRLRGKKGSDLSNKEIIFLIQENLIKTALDVCLRAIKSTLNSQCLLEVPLEQLLSEFKYLFENRNDLKTFLSYYPHDFIIKDDMILLRICDNATDISDTPLKSKLSSLNKSVKPHYKPVVIEQVKDFCVNFLLQNVGVNIQFPLTQFKQCISLAPPELHQILSNEKDFRSIISQCSNVLSLTDNYILLKKSYEDPSINLPKQIMVNDSLMYFIWVLKEKVGVDIEFPIARLKIYVDLAPSDVKIEDIFQLKSFLRKYPNIFIVNNNNVILKNLDDENYFKFTRYEKLCYIESYSPSEAIAFYARVLNRFCSNLEVPVEHLFGYRSLAPVEVFALAKSTDELKKFLSTHPDIFTVQENNVCLTKIFDRSESNEDVYDDQEAIKFYSAILDRVSHNNEFPIVRLFGYQYLASVEVRDLIKTPLELKDFLNKHPNIFFVNNDVVSFKKLISKNKDIHFNEKLRQSDSFLKEVKTTLSGLNLNSQPDNKTKSPTNAQNKIPLVGRVNKGFISKKSVIIRSIRFYSNIMFKKGPNSEHLISNLLCFRNEATNEIKEIAKKPIELITFLSRFPQIFTVDHGKLTVMLTDMVSFYKNERSWIKELLPKYHQSTTNHETVVSGIQFYVNIIFERGLEVLPVKSLFRYRKTAMGDVQALANNANELKDFLSMYPEVFIINDEGVSLTAVAISHKTEPKWIEEIIGNNNLFNQSSNTNGNENNELSKRNLTSDNLSIRQNDDHSTLKDVNTLATVNFFEKILETEGKGKNITDKKLFEYLNVAPPEVKELFKAHSDLKDFFIKYSDVFAVKDNFVSLVSSKRDSKVKKRKKKHSVKKMDSANSPAIVSDNSDILNNTENSSDININVNFSDNHHTHVSDEKKSVFNVVSAILFYSNIIWRKGPHLEHTIGSIFSHHSKAPSNVRDIVKNIKQLKEFLSKYPQLFSVNHEKQTVILSDLKTFHKNRRSWIKDMLPVHHQSTANHEVIVSTIQFYSNILFEKSPKSELPLSILFSHRNAAMEDVQMMVKSVKELNTFLSMFPNIFLIDKDKISLTDVVVSQLKQPKWIEQLVTCHESSISNIQLDVNSKKDTDIINEEFLKKKKIVTRRAVQFFYKIMLSSVSNRGFSLSQLFDYLQEAPCDVKEVVKTINELRDFFSKYPHIFTITDNVVFLTKFNDT